MTRRMCRVAGSGTLRDELHLSIPCKAGCRRSEPEGRGTRFDGELGRTGVPAVRTGASCREAPMASARVRPSLSHWAGRPEHERSPWIDDGRLPALRTQLGERIMTTPGIARVVGAWGVGKSRLVLEALRTSAELDAEYRDLSDFVLYAVETEIGSGELYAAVQALVDAMARAVVVVDCCLPQTHRVLAGTVSRTGSRVSLITIDDDLSGVPPDETTIKLDEAPTSVIDAIVQRNLPGLGSGEHGRLARFSKGCPEIAIRIGEAWRRSIPIGHTTDDGLVDAIVRGHRPDEPALMLKSAKLIAVFGMVGLREDAGAQLDKIAMLGRSLRADDLRATVEDFVRRGVVQRRGRYVVLRPRALALNLAERQWRAWSGERWDEVLSGNTSVDLKVAAARGLALLNTTDISQEVVARVCRIGGGFDGWNEISRDGHAEVLARLAEIETRVVFAQIDRSLAAVERSRISGEIRRHLVWALEKVAFRRDTFSDGARMLLSLAIAEDETCSNNATGQFTALFPLFLGQYRGRRDRATGVPGRSGSLDQLRPEGGCRTGSCRWIKDRGVLDSRRRRDARVSSGPGALVPDDTRTGC